MKKIVLLLVVIFMFVSKSFAFLDEGTYYWAKDAVNRWNSKGIISGYTDGSFRGNNNITRAEVICIINKLNNSGITTNKRMAKDIKNTDWFYNDVNRAIHLGLVSIDSNYNIRPNDYATREEVITMLSNLFNISYSGNADAALVRGFLDYNEIESTNYNKVSGIVELGIVNGYPDNTLRPKSLITRAEFVCMLDNAIYDIYSYGRYTNKAIVGNIIINGKNVEISNSEINGKVFVLDGARDALPNLINTNVSKGINSRVGEILTKNVSNLKTITEHEYDNPQEDGEVVFARVYYSEDKWTNDDVEVTIKINDKNYDIINKKDNKIIFDRNGEEVIEYEYNGKIIKIKAKVNNIDKVLPVVTATVQNNVYTANVIVDVEDDGLSPIKRIYCSNGVTITKDEDTGIINNNIIIEKDGVYTISVEDEAGNIGKTTVSIKGLVEPDVTYVVEHYLQDIDGTYLDVATKTQNVVGKKNLIVSLDSLEKVSDIGYIYKYGKVNGVVLEETVISENMLVKLYYEREKYVVNYDANDGINAPENQIKMYDVAVNLSNIEPTRNGYTFLGWSDNKDLLDIKYNSGDNYNENKNITLYAVWSANLYNVVAKLNPVLSASILGDGNKRYGSEVTLEVVPQIGYNFDGWEIINGNIVLSSLSDTVTIFTMPNENVELKANLSLKTYTITYDANDGINAPENQIKTHDITVNLSDIKPTRNGFKFLGWSEDKDNTTKLYQAEEEFLENKNIVLYAIWEVLP